jgi:hypothetical protein
MRILIVDLASITRKFFELEKDQRLTDATALSASVAHIARASDGFDRLVVARDLRPSFRRAICPTYKAGREDPGVVYEKRGVDVMTRLYADGASVYPSNTEAKDPRMEPVPGGFPEADDVIATLARCYREARADSEDWSLAIASDDSDLCTLVDDEAQISIRRFDGAAWYGPDVIAKFGCAPSLITHAKALGGDAADGYKPFPHPDAKPDDKTTKPGIGFKTAVKLLEQWGSYGDPDAGLRPGQRVLWAAQEGLLYEQKNPGVGPPPGSMPDCHERRCLLAGGVAAIELGYRCATMADELPLDFSRILHEPKRRPIAPPRKEPEPASDKLVPATTKATMILTSGVGFDRLALQPTALEPLLSLSETFFNSRMFPQFKTVEEVATVIFEARERGVPAATALRNAYVVKGRPAWSAAMIAGMVKASAVCKLFRIIESTSQSATVEYDRHDEPGGPFRFTFTIDEARHAGWLKSGERGDGKWVTNPRTMLRWAAMREATRAFFPDVVSGCYTREELVGDVSNEDLKNEARALDGILEQ